MGIFDALTTAVSGLQAQSFALQNISGNIANSQTVGYKETDTSFQDLVSAAAQNQQTSGGVFASSVSTNSVQGTIQSTSVSTDMAINGDGYFVVAQPTGQTDNLPVFNSVNYYTRRGDFQMNQAGFLVNGAGYYLMGIPVNPNTGNPVGSVPQVLQFDNNFVPAQATTQIHYQANLPSSPPSLLNQGDFEANPLAGAPVAAKIQGSGAALLPDAPATGTGTNTMLATTTLLSLGINSGDQITVSDGTNTTTYTSTGSDTVQDLMDYINSGASGIGFEPEQVVRLIECGADVCAAIYPIKRIDWDKVRSTIETARPNPAAASLKYVFEVDNPAAVTERSGFVRVRYAGTGFLMLRRGALERMCSHYPELRYRRDHSLDAATPSDHRFALFECMIGEDGTYLSEDFAFCKRWTDMGGEIWADLRSKLNHVGPMAFCGDLSSQFAGVGA